MSKLEIILVAVLVCIVAGAGAVYWQRKQVDAGNPKFATDTTVLQQSGTGHNDGQENNNKRIIEKCVAIVKRGEEAQQLCDKIMHDLPIKLKAASDKATGMEIKHGTKFKIDDKERVSIEKDMDTSKKCINFSDHYLNIKKTVQLFEEGRFVEAERLCDDIQVSIPPGL